MFNNLDANSSGYLEQSELIGSFYSSTLNRDKRETTSDITSNDDVFMGGEMEMDMSNDSFNAQ